MVLNRRGMWLMSFLSAIPIIGDLVKGGVDIIKKIVPDKDKQKELEYALKQLALDAENKIREKELEAQKEIIVSEVKSESWLARNWRPIIMLMFGVIIVNNYIVNPWISELLSINVMMDIPPDMWGVLKLGLGGYVVGRSVEKGVKLWKK